MMDGKKLSCWTVVTDKSECFQIYWSVSYTGITIDLRFEAAFTNSRPASPAENGLVKRTESKIILVNCPTTRTEGKNIAI